MKTSMRKLIPVVMIATSLIYGCKKDEDEVPTPKPPTNEEEVITTMTLYFTDSANSSNVVSATYKDPDGDGGNTYTKFDSIKLKANTTYYTKVVLLNETATPADSISNEVLEEANDHLFIYTVSGVNANITITDTDSNSPALPIGLQSKWKTGAASNGTIQVVLKHQPGVKNGTATPGETDIDLTFKAVVQ